MALIGGGLQYYKLVRAQLGIATGCAISTQISDLSCQGHEFVAFEKCK